MARLCKKGDCGADNNLIRKLQVEEYGNFRSRCRYKEKLQQIKHYLSIACVVVVMRNMKLEYEGKFYKFIQMIESAD